MYHNLRESTFNMLAPEGFWFGYGAVCISALLGYFKVLQVVYEGVTHRLRVRYGLHIFPLLTRFP